MMPTRELRMVDYDLFMGGLSAYAHGQRLISRDTLLKVARYCASAAYPDDLTFHIPTSVIARDCDLARATVSACLAIMWDYGVISTVAAHPGKVTTYRWTA